jgi:hypothetical protein
LDDDKGVEVEIENADGETEVIENENDRLLTLSLCDKGRMSNRGCQIEDDPDGPITPESLSGLDCQTEDEGEPIE